MTYLFAAIVMLLTLFGLVLGVLSRILAEDHPAVNLDHPRKETDDR